MVSTDLILKAQQMGVQGSPVCLPCFPYRGITLFTLPCIMVSSLYGGYVNKQIYMHIKKRLQMIPIVLGYIYLHF
jgi:hypothetical protein